MDVQHAYTILTAGALLVIAAILPVMLIRSIRGPGVTDRLLSINMIGTLVIAAIVLLSRLLGEAWLLDVALIYTMISLLSVLILARVYIPHHPDRKRFREEEDGTRPNPPEPRKKASRRKRIAQAGKRSAQEGKRSA